MQKRNSVPGPVSSLLGGHAGGSPEVPRGAPTHMDVPPKQDRPAHVRVAGAAEDLAVASRRRGRRSGAGRASLGRRPGEPPGRAGPDRGRRATDPGSLALRRGALQPAPPHRAPPQEDPDRPKRLPIGFIAARDRGTQRGRSALISVLWHAEAGGFLSRPPRPASVHLC